MCPLKSSNLTYNESLYTRHHCVCSRSNFGGPKCHNLLPPPTPPPPSPPYTNTHTPTAHLVLDSHCAVVLSGRGQKRRGWGTVRGVVVVWWVCGGAHSLLRLTLRLLLSFSKHQSFLSRFLSLSLHPSLKRWKFAFVPSPATLPLCIRPPLYPWNYLLAFSFSAGSLHATRWLALFHHIISPLHTSLSLSLLKRLLHLQFDFVYTSLCLSLLPFCCSSLCLSPLHIRSICPFIIWLVLFFDRSISKANTGVCVVLPITQMAERWWLRCFCSRCCSESHFPSLLKHSLKLTGSTLREKSCLIVMQKHFHLPLFLLCMFSPLIELIFPCLPVFLSIYLSMQDFVLQYLKLVNRITSNERKTM